MRVLQVAAAILTALLVQTLAGRHLGGRRTFFDLFLVTAAGFGLVAGRAAGMSAGTAAGLVQDAFSGGLLGLNGLSKTTVGYLAGIVGNRLIIRGWSGRFAFFALASLLDLVILLLLGAAVERSLVWTEGLTPVAVCAGNGLVGAAGVALAERWRLA